MDLFRRAEPVLQSRDLLRRPAPIPEMRIRALTPNVSSMQKRASDDSDSSSSGSADTTPIVIGVVVPVIVIAVIMFVIWRRRQRIVKVEEANDKYRSLDFGVDESAFKEKNKKATGGHGPEMSIADVKSTLRNDRCLSLDLGTVNPYVLPPEVHQSRESLHSLSRSMNTGDDKYRTTTFIPDDGSLRSPSSMSRGDGSSIFSGSTRHRTGTMCSESKTDLLPRIPTPRDHSETNSMKKPLSAQPGLLAPIPQEADRTSTISTGSNTAAFRASNNYLGQFIRGGEKKKEDKKAKQPELIVSETEIQVTPSTEEPRELPAAVVHYEPPSMNRANSLHELEHTEHGIAELANVPQTSHDSALQPSIPVIETTSYEMDGSSQSQSEQTQSTGTPAHHSQEAFVANTRPSVPTINTQNQQPLHSPQEFADDASDYYDDDVYNDYQDYAGYADRRSMMGTRPLPPDDPSENPEQRANRIRSFYKEYFDDSGKPGQANRTMDYYDGSEQYDDFDYGYYEQPHSRGPSIRSDNRHRAFSHGSHGYYPPRPRAYSSMSGRVGPQSRKPPKKKQPPPKPLMALPTPHKLKDDDFLPNAIDYAPPQIFKNQRSGTPDNLRGGLRPYSPSVRPHVPLTSSFDDLAAVPSP